MDACGRLSLIEGGGRLRTDTHNRELGVYHDRNTLCRQRITSEVVENTPLRSQKTPRRITFPLCSTTGVLLPFWRLSRDPEADSCGIGRTPSSICGLERTLVESGGPLRTRCPSMTSRRANLADDVGPNWRHLRFLKQERPSTLMATISRAHRRGDAYDPSRWISTRRLRRRAAPGDTAVTRWQTYVRHWRSALDLSFATR